MQILGPTQTCWLLLLGLTIAVGAQEAAPSSDAAARSALTVYKGRTIATTMHYSHAPWLIRESRDREEDCQTLLDQLSVKPGMTVADMGCGNGFYSLRIAELVGVDGKVLAVDIQQEMLRLLEFRAKEGGLNNIVTILGDLDDPKLPTSSVDLILCVDVYHEFSHPQQMLTAMRQSLKPNGRLVLAEFRAEDPAVPIKPLHKMSKKQVLQELLPNGFRWARDFDGLPWQHLMFFTRDDARASTDRRPANRNSADTESFK